MDSYIHQHKKCTDSTGTWRKSVKHPEDGNRKADEILGILAIFNCIVYYLRKSCKYFEKYLLAHIFLRVTSDFISRVESLGFWHTHSTPKKWCHRHGSAKFFRQGLDSKCFGLFGPYSLGHNYSNSAPKQPQTTCKWINVPGFQQHTKTDIF